MTARSSMSVARIGTLFDDEPIGSSAEHGSRH